MKQNKQRLKSMLENTELLYEDEIHDLADVISSSSTKSVALLDPFEDYIEELRHKFHANPHIFRSRLVKGYNALLRQLQEE